MAEFCLECFAEMFNEKPKKRKYVLSKEEDFCEGCGEWKRVVVRKRGILTFIRCKIAVRRFRKKYRSKF